MSDGGGGFIVGDTRVGKSTAVSEFADRLFDKMKSERPDAQWERPVTVGTPIRGIKELRPESSYQHPLVVVFVDPRPTFKSLMKTTAQAMDVYLKTVEASRWLFLTRCSISPMKPWLTRLPTSSRSCARQVFR
jgi:hypothetical protein